MISLRRLTKRHGEKLAVDDVTADILPGRVTGFLGPNGAGKSTTMRMIVGHDHPTSGEALIHGRPYAALRHPLREVGALLDARALHPGRTARHHLLAMARSTGADTVIVHGATVEEVGDAAHRLGARLHELRAEAASLEDAYLRLTRGSAEYTTSAPLGGGRDREGGER